MKSRWSSPTKLLLHCDGANAATTFADSSQSAHVVTAHGAAQIDTAQKEFGTASGYFTAAADYLSLDSATDFTFGTGDFTIETWLRRETTAVPVVLIDFRSGSDHMPPYVYYDAGSLRYYCNGADRITATATLAVGTWHHVAVARAGSNTRMFLDGVQVGSTYVAADNLTCAPGGPSIGATPSFMQPETAAWVAKVVAAGGTVSSGMQTAVDNYIATLKAAGIFGLADRIWLHSLENPQSGLIDLVHALAGTAYNSPTFIPGHGFVGDGATSYIDTNFNCLSSGVNYQASIAGGGIWDATVTAPAGGVPMGLTYYGGYMLDGTTQYIDGNSYWRLNSAGGVSTPYPGPGMYFINRTDSYNTQLYHNGTVVTTNTNDPNSGLFGLNIYVLARNSGSDTPSSNSTDEISASFLFGSLNATQQMAFYTATQPLMPTSAVARSSAPALMILLAPDDADAVRGFSRVTQLAALKPRELRDGNFILPLTVLDDPAHVEHADFLRTLPTVDPREYMGMLLEDALGTIRPS